MISKVQSVDSERLSKEEGSPLEGVNRNDFRNGLWECRDTTGAFRSRRLGWKERVQASFSIKIFMSYVL